jgi:hypothetical protein
LSLNYIYIDFYLSIKISIINIETMSKTMSESPESSDTTIELQLGDIIHISNNVNEQLNDKTFIIDYIDNSKAYLINTDTLEKIRLSISPEGIIGDGNISRIEVLSRNETGSYARQYGLTPGKWVDIFFGGDLPVIITGEITNLEEDMIEVTTIDGDVLYINFDYKGIPENLPIEYFQIREKPSEPLVKVPEPEETVEEITELEELEKPKQYVEPSKIQLTVPVKDIKDQIKEFIVKADQVQFGDEEFGPIVQYEDVATQSQRYSIEAQVSDLLDELLSTVPNAQRTPKVLNNIHIMIERFKQLREEYSSFDEYGNVKSFYTKEATYKPIVKRYFFNLLYNLYWILPVVKNKKYIYNFDNMYDEENDDFINLSVDQSLIDLREEINTYKSNNLPSDQNNYAEFYRNVDALISAPFRTLADDEQAGVFYDLPAYLDINTVVDNLEDLYSSIYSNNTVKTRRFVIQKYISGLEKLDTVDSTSAKMVTVRTRMTQNEPMDIKSFLFLPEPVIRFSKVNLPGTSILDRANLNTCFLNYWQLLKKNTKVNKEMIINEVFDDLNEEKVFNEANYGKSITEYILNADVNPDNYSRSEMYERFIRHIIPKTRILFNLMKKYITGKLSIVEVVSYLEPFLIYADDLTFMQYKEITEFINEQISKNNKNYVERVKLFSMIVSSQKTMRKELISTKAFTVIETLTNNQLRNEVFNEGYGMRDPELTFTNTEILKKITVKDYKKLYSSALSIQSFPLMFPTEFSNLFDEEKKKIDGKLKEEEKDNKCKTFIIAKYYNTPEKLAADNGVNIYFDRKYDKTNYGLLEDNYAKQVMTMAPEDLKEFIAKDLMVNKKMVEDNARYLANTLVDGYKEVKDDHYAILYNGYRENVSNEVSYYVRKNNKWEKDEELSEKDINTDENSILCELQSNCINVATKSDDKCESLKENELSLQNKLLKDVTSEFDMKYKMSKEEMQKSLQDKFDYLMSIIPALNKIEINTFLKYNNQKYKIGATEEEQISTKPVSPYQRLLNIILGQSDFVKKQYDIIKFANYYSRSANEGVGPLGEPEAQDWLYCRKSNAPLMPCFKADLAQAYVTGGSDDYEHVLEYFKSTIGKLSDDGDYWCDVNSGWQICPVDFDVEEGYEEGFKVSTRAVMEEDAGNKIVSALAEKSLKYTTPETRMISNVVNALSVAMGINIEIQKEFIINLVLASIKDTVESESDYKHKVREMAEKGKKMMSYKDFYNTAILFYTLGSYLIAIQTCMPPVRTRKTHPGCVRSFSGYPFEGTGDFSSLNYLACVAYDIRESGEPWNVLKGKKQEVILNKIKGSIDDVLMANPEVKRKFEEKTTYLLTAPPDEIPEEHDIANWAQFLPPLKNFKIKHLTNISPEFKKSLMSDLRNGTINQREKILVVESKMIQFSLALIEKIQEIVKKNQLLLHTANNEPYLENACCESKEGESTISYFIKHAPQIQEYNEIVTQLSNIMEDIISYTKSGLFFSNFNTKNIYPDISSDFSEKTIYLAFIYFCKFNSLMPIPEDLLPVCTNKPDEKLLNKDDSIERTIQKLKEDGRNYTLEQFLRLLQILGKNNIININLDKPETSYITKLTKLLENIDTENDEVVEKSLRDLISNSLDSFDIASEEYTKETKELNNFLIRNIESMREEIVDFVKKNSGTNVTNSSIKKMIKTMENLSNWVADTSNRNENIKISDDKTYNIVNFYKNFINNFVHVFPNIILNEVDYTNTHIPDYYGFSSNHGNKLKRFISGYYEKLFSFYGVPTISNILTTIQKTAKNIVLIANSTPSFTSIKIGEETKMIPIIDERTSRHLFEYYLLRVLLNYIELTDEEDMIVTEVVKKTELTDIFTVEYLEEKDTRIDLSLTSRNQTDISLLTGNKKELRQKVVEVLIAFIDIMHNEKDTIDTSYEEIQDRVFKLREKEKDDVTDRLKRMTDVERDTDTMLKINKLGMYSKGMQKGLTVLDKDFYDEEQQFRDKMVKAEKMIRKKNPDANDENIDVLLEEYMEQQGVEAGIDADTYDMSNMGEDYQDGVGDEGYCNYGGEEVDWDC